MKLPRWLGGKPSSAPLESEVTAPIELLSADDVNFYERIRVMHVQQHPTSRFFPLNRLPVAEAIRRGNESWFMHQLGKEPSEAQYAYAISPQFEEDKKTFKESK